MSDLFIKILHEKTKALVILDYTKLEHVFGPSKAFVFTQ